MTERELKVSKNPTKNKGFNTYDQHRRYYTDSDLIDSYGADAQRSKGFGREFQMGEKLSGGGKVRGMGAAKQGGKFGKNG